MRSDHDTRPAVDVNLTASTRRFTVVMRATAAAFATLSTRLGGPLRQMHLSIGTWPDPRAAKRARKARTRALRMSLKAHAR